MSEICNEHSGCLKDIANIKDENKAQWEAINDVRCRVDSILVRINVLLTTVVVSLFLLVINIMFKLI